MCIIETMTRLSAGLGTVTVSVSQQGSQILVCVCSGPQSCPTLHNPLDWGLSIVISYINKYLYE